MADVLGMLAGGMTTEAIVADYPYLQAEDVAACLDFAARLARHEEVAIKRDAA